MITATYDYNSYLCVPESINILHLLILCLLVFPSDVKTIDSLVNSFGACGPFQIRLVVATSAAQLCAVWGMLFMVFGIYDSPWRCSDGLLQNSSTENSTHTNWTTVIREFYADVNESFGNSSNMSSCDTLRMCKDVEFETKSSTVVTEWRLVCDQMWLQAFIIAIQMAGVLVGSYLGSIIGDNCGRRVNLYINVGLHTVLNVIAAFSVDYQMFICLRFFLGVCVGGILSCCLLYPVEFVGNKWRTLLSVFPVWNLGAVTFSLVVLLLKNWRHLHIATALFSFLVFLLGFWVPESLRWLALHGKVAKAKGIAQMAAAMNSRPPPNTVPLEIFAKEARKKMRAKVSHYQRVPDLFKSEKYFTSSVKLGFMWIGVSLVYYSISFSTKFFSGDFYVNFIIFSVAEIPGIIFVAPISRNLGSRLGSLIFLFIISAACFIVVIVAFVGPDDKKGTIMYIFALLAKINILAAWSVMTMFSRLVYPSDVRSLATDYLNYCARIGAIIAPFLIPAVSGSLHVMFLILGIFLIVCCVVLLTVPVSKETKQKDPVQEVKSHLSIIEEETEMDVRNSESEGT